MALATDSPLALANRFRVTVDVPGTMDLGSWGQIKGLNVTFDVVEYRAGDNGNERWYDLGFSKYDKVTLSRAVSPDTQKVKDWVSLTSRDGYMPGSMVIELLDSAGEKVFEWVMRSAMPTKWSIGGFDASTSKLATEELEIVHMGFLDDETK